MFAAVWTTKLNSSKQNTYCCPVRPDYTIDRGRFKPRDIFPIVVCLPSVNKKVYVDHIRLKPPFVTKKTQFRIYNRLDK